MANWLSQVALFLGCEVSQLNPNYIYIATIALLSVIFWSFSYILSRSGRR